MKVTSDVLGTLLGQRPDTAVLPIIDIIGNPAPGRTAYRGARKLCLTVGEHDEEDAGRLMTAVEGAL